MRHNNWIEELEKLVPASELIRDEVDLLAYSRDASVVPGGMPEVAVRPSDAGSLGRLLAFANRNEVPVYTRGAGTMYAGAAVPSEAGLMLDLSGLNRIIEIDRDRGIVVVEPGVTFGALLKVLKAQGLTVGVVPMTGASGTVGGAVASNGLGTGSPKFQSLGDEVAGLEVMLPDGKIVRTGSGASSAAGFFQRYCIGPDLTGLFIGSNSGFGLITKIALWLHRHPEHMETLSLGFPDLAMATSFLIDVQNDAMTRNVWYGAVYDGATIRGKVAAARPDHPAESLPGACIALDLRGDADEVTLDRERLIRMAAVREGERFDLYDEIFFNSMRHQYTYWYSFAGYCALSRSALIMNSLPTEQMPSFFEKIFELRERFPQFVWGGGIILCRRGLHGGLIGFYDEATQWEEMQEVLKVIRPELLDMGCVPYKGGKLWSDMGQGYPAYRDLLSQIKTAIDPAGIMARSNLGY